MPTLYDALLRQHARQLTPVRCAYSTIAQLHRYFEDVVLENDLNALVIESLPRLAREKARLRELVRDGRHTFFFVSKADALKDIVYGVAANSDFVPVILQHAGHHVNEHFVIIADTRFSALLVTVRGRGNATAGDEVMWTFEPDVVYSALEYLMARVAAEHPYQAEAFGAAVRTSMPKATSLQLTLSVTTKLAHLLQEQAGREIAVNRIATAIRESLELGVILQKTVDEVATALNVPYCALRLEDQQALTYSYCPPESDGETSQRDEMIAQFDIHCAQFARDRELITRDADDADAKAGRLPLAAVPLVFHERLVGALQVMTSDRKRVWQENEVLLLRTVADQVAVAVSQADLFAQIQQQALTDALTGCYNRRSFEMQLDRDLQMARRLHQPLSLLMVDLDRFKLLNDSAGHDGGDMALRKLADCFRQELRGVDSAARFGGDEFAVILPQAYTEGALIVAERLRARIQQIEVPGFGRLSASIGIASFPAHATSRAELITATDVALYSAKRAGRNLVCVTDSSPGSLVSTSPVVRGENNQIPEAARESIM